MEFSELIKKRRSCRAFQNTPVTEEQLQSIAKAGQWAPSPLNEQPFQFIAVTDPGVKAQIQKISIEAKQTVINKNGPAWVEKYPMNFIGDCPLILVVIYDADKGGLGSYFEQPHGALQSASACIQNMMLQAKDLGLDSLWFTFFNPSALKSILDIPEELDIAGAIMVGTPAMNAKAPKRRPPMVHRDRFNAEAH
ncbi:nitroreductase family protein [Desulfobacula sp.]|uniref:nitroreductase family protein n=1 Tax=Desulfobacula sp. TaxID=2593537 RepID=UPI00262ABC91|nr:nitroreductase family protein [Desulfobacula sp.]